MIRVLAPRPQVYDLPRLHAEARAAGAGCLAVNEVGDQIAAYWDDDAQTALTVQEWAAIVAAHSAAGDLPVDLLLDATDPRDTSRIRRSEP